MKRLTDVGYWDKHWWGPASPQRLRFLYRDVDLEFVRLIRKLAGRADCRILEAGAGGSRILPYLARKYGYQTVGTDFSHLGCRLLQANFALADATGGVICEDLFASSPRPEIFDLVFSFGLIEHFDDTQAVVSEHLRWVRPGGWLVLTVPNLEGWNGRLMKKLAPPHWSRHKVLSRRQLADMLKSLGLERVRTGCLGSFFLQIGTDAGWTGLEQWLRLARKLAPRLLRVANGLLSLFFRLLPVRPHFRMTSPTLFAVGRKQSTDNRSSP